jgi:prepilin-type N-terminal cleavage/methylation domain-containing protein
MIKNGFTLAEILITLLIIGVVASLVIPNLINDTKNEQYKVAWKKSYADVNQAFMKVLQDNGGTIKNACSTTNCFLNLFVPHLNSSKICYYGSNNGSCWTEQQRHFNGIWYVDGEAGGIVLSNGVSIRLWLNTANCTTAVGSPAILYRCGGMMIDTNGLSMPNTIGKDIFGIYVMENQLKPFGSLGDGDVCNDNPPSGLSWGCSAKYLFQ